ncbi:hypothetical protein M404DRAFT_998390 [Pisolithus tinctorius Marx 270]|uniref:Uncharacterized protein n=1 Tax=Pisolithus tinctorius Marx 270 TaxID=870435 RepID=A0A0C3P1M3_PISTI|nr:hypothetical protein M404DRAFT_998390 [Pisolithus tinctorius Marx 270]
MTEQDTTGRAVVGKTVQKVRQITETVAWYECSLVLFSGAVDKGRWVSGTFLPRFSLSAPSRHS